MSLESAFRNGSFDMVIPVGGSSVSDGRSGVSRARGPVRWVGSVTIGNPMPTPILVRACAVTLLIRFGLQAKSMVVCCLRPRVAPPATVANEATMDETRVSPLGELCRSL
jgi:hypothetical protein